MSGLGTDKLESSMKLKRYVALVRDWPDVCGRARESRVVAGQVWSDGVEKALAHRELELWLRRHGMGAGVVWVVEEEVEK